MAGDVTEAEGHHVFLSTDYPSLNGSSLGWNSSLNGTAQPEIFYEFYQTEQIIFLCILFTFILIGNISVLGAILISKNRKSRMNFFIMHLAIADLFTGVVCVLTDIIWKSLVIWYGGNFGCKIVRFMQSVATYGSTYVLVALSIDRLDAIARPMSFSRSGLRSKILIATAWMLSIVCSVPMLIINEAQVIRSVQQCWILLPEQWHWQVLVTFHAVFVFLLPSVIIACCYCIIVLIIWSKSSLEVEPKKVCKFKVLGGRAKRSAANKSDGTALNGRSHQKYAGSSSRGLIPKARVKTIKMTFVIVLVFIVCWSPYFVFDLLDVYGHLPHSQEKIAIAIFFQSLGSLNSAANPIIYCLFSTKICNNWRRISCIDWLIKKLSCCAKKPVARTPTTLTSEYTLVDTHLHSASPKPKRGGGGGVGFGGGGRVHRHILPPAAAHHHHRHQAAAVAVSPSNQLLKTVALPSSNISGSSGSQTGAAMYNVNKNRRQHYNKDKQPVLMDLV